MRVARGLLVVVVSLLVLGATSGQFESVPQHHIQPHLFTSRDGRQVEAELGRFRVPENRQRPSERTIELAFVRFRSTTAEPGHPIVYLAGGPGGSGIETARAWRFDVFMAMREQADIIAFDQRGTGLSDGPPACATPDLLDLSLPLTRDVLVDHYRAGAERCLSWWQEQGVDLDAYSTRENAKDIDDLRRVIGADRIDLWAISYGTHLGAAYLREHHDRVGRAVFAGYEGPDDTVKSPAGTDAMIGRLSTAIGGSTPAGVDPDLAGLMRRVLSRLEQEPARVSVDVDGKRVPILLGAFPVQRVTGGLLADPRTSVQLLPLYSAMDRGEYEQMASLVVGSLAEDFAEIRAMPLVSDLASGISRERRARVDREARTAILDDALNFPMPHLHGLMPELDLGEAFRAPLAVDTPILFISGTLDGRTYPAAAGDALATLPASRQLVVNHGGHNIYEADPRMASIVRTWLREGVSPDTLTFPLPRIAR